MPKLFTILIILLIPPAMNAQEWKLLRSGEGIEVYISPIEGTELAMFRATTRVKASLSSLVSIWSSPSEFVSWMYTCKYAELLAKETEQTYIIYLISTVPWPLPNRDNILRSALTQDKKTGKVTIMLTGLPEFVPKKKDLVRAVRSFGKVEMTPLGNQEVDLVFEFFMDPGGMIPAPIVNLFLLDFPFYTLKKLREEVHRDIFQKAVFRFIKEY